MSRPLRHWALLVLPRPCRLATRCAGCLATRRRLPPPRQTPLLVLVLVPLPPHRPLRACSSVPLHGIAQTRCLACRRLRTSRHRHRPRRTARSRPRCVRQRLWRRQRRAAAGFVRHPSPIRRRPTPLAARLSRATLTALARLGRGDRSSASATRLARPRLHRRPPLVSRATFSLRERLLLPLQRSCQCLPPSRRCQSRRPTIVPSPAVFG